MEESKLIADVRAQDLMAKALPVVEARHREAWLVGGWIRDRFLGHETHDFDFVVPSGAIATARELADILGGAFVLLDEERDTARVLVGPPPEALCFDLAGLRAPTIGADLLARDFTVNAMAVPVGAWGAPEGAVIDPAGGRADLAARLLRAVSADSFREDPLRMLRAVRLAAALGFHVESQTAAWILRDAELLDAVSRERVRDELAQILAQPQAGRSLRQLEDLALLERVMPELALLRGVGVAQGDGRSALQHSLATVDAVESLRSWVGGHPPAEQGWPYEMLEARLGPYRARLAEDLAVILPGGRNVATLLALAALLHDVGKGAAGQGSGPLSGRLLGHEVLGASMAATIMRRLCFSGPEVVRVRLAVRNHMRPGQLVQETGGEPSRRAIYRFYRDAGPSGVDTILLSLADHRSTRGAGLDAEHWARHLALSAALLYARYEQRSEIVDPPPIVDGHDLMSSLGLAPSPEVGVLLDNIREAQAAGEVQAREEALDLARRLLERGPF